MGAELTGSGTMVWPVCYPGDKSAKEPPRDGGVEDPARWLQAPKDQALGDWRDGDRSSTCTYPSQPRAGYRRANQKEPGHHEPQEVAVHCPLH